MMGRMQDTLPVSRPPPDRRETALSIVEDIDRARNLLLDHEVGLHKGDRQLDDYEEMRMECDRILREASLRVAVLAEV
jgi:hypothetical protein